MKKLLVLVMMGSCLGLYGADEFEVGTVVHPVVAKLGAPKMIEGFGEGQMAITTSSDRAARHFAQGLTMLNTSWGFEAYRHFCEAVRHDPECLMAYWGIALALADGQHEFFDERRVAIDRMLDLLEAKGEATRWNELEVRFAQAAGFLFTNGVRAAGRAFEAAAERFPANVQAKMLALFLQRDGFDPSGDPRLGQKKSTEGLRQLLADHPGNVSVMSMWVNSQSEAPGKVPFLRKDVLPVARALVARDPEYPPFQLILAQTEARCGDAGRALAAATAARSLFEDYLEEGKVTIYDCEGLVQARLYQVHLNHLRGRTAEALAGARELAALEIVRDRVFSVGAALLMWEGRTVAARLMMSGETKADFLKGQETMTALPDEAWFKEQSYAISYRDCLAFYLGVRGAIAGEDQKVAKGLFEQFSLRVQAFQKSRGLASKSSSYSSWMRAMNTLGVMMAELRGLLAEMEDGATRLSAANWYRAAIDRQERPANLLPPSVAYPMQWRLGNHYLAREEFEKAVSSYQRGLELRPNHPGLLTDLRRAAVKLGNTELASSLQKQIEAVKK